MWSNPTTWNPDVIVGTVVLIVCCVLTHVFASWMEWKVNDLFRRADVRRGDVEW